MALYKFLNDVYAVSFLGRAVKEHVGDVLFFSDYIKDQESEVSRSWLHMRCKGVTQQNLL